MNVFLQGETASNSYEEKSKREGNRYSNVGKACDIPAFVSVEVGTLHLMFSNIKTFSNAKKNMRSIQYH